jgi:ATP-dependent DNA helicase PIF1
MADLIDTKDSLIAPDTNEDEKTATPSASTIIPPTPSASPQDSLEEEIITQIQLGNNVFITGAGGCGKSYLLKCVCDTLIARGFKVSKTGSTGVAAENIGGTTLHSWAGIKLGDKSAEVYSVIICNQRTRPYKNWTTTEVLVIDEISMIGQRLFTMLSTLGSMIRKNKAPFGGIRLIVCGDMCQLPPIKDEYIFKSNVWDLLNLQIFRLEHPWRFQHDLDFFYLLNRARLGDLTDNDVQQLNLRAIAYQQEVKGKPFREDQIKPTRLFSKKMDVNQLNLLELSKIDEDQTDYSCSDHIQRKTKTLVSQPIEAYQKIMDEHVPPKVSLKKGAQVMLTWNLDVGNGLCNGSRGVVLECLDNEVMVKLYGL